MDIIRCENLSKIYQAGDNKIFALDDVTVSFEQGTFTAITGPSGSGKSTMLHLLSGLDAPSQGKVFYQDKSLYDYKDNQLSVLRRRRFGFVFQRGKALPMGTLYEKSEYSKDPDYRIEGIRKD